MSSRGPASCDRPPPPAAEIVTSAQARAARVEAMARPTDEVDALLARAADQFVVTTATGPSVVAGYPWFGEWSRDTMTSYEGLFLSRRAARGGPRSPAAFGSHVVGGHAREHRRRGRPRVQHRRRHALVHPRRWSPRRRDGRPRSPRQARRRARRHHRRALARHPVRHQGGSERTACCNRVRPAGR